MPAYKFTSSHLRIVSVFGLLPWQPSHVPVSPFSLTAADLQHLSLDQRLNHGQWSEVRDVCVCVCVTSEHLQELFPSQE